MIIIQNIEGKVLSLHTTVPAFCRYYNIDKASTEKYVREKLHASEEKSIVFNDFRVVRKNPV